MVRGIPIFGSSSSLSGIPSTALRFGEKTTLFAWARTVPDLRDRPGDGLDQRLGRVWRRIADLVQDLALGGDDPGGDLRAPDVDAYGVHRPAFQSTISSSACPEYRLRVTV
jgi:hypothetical protein